MFGCFCLFFWGTRCWFLNSCRLLAVTPRQIGLVRDSCMYVSPRSLLFWERGSGIEKRGSPQVIVQTTGRSLEQLSDIWKDSAIEQCRSCIHWTRAKSEPWECACICCGRRFENVHALSAIEGNLAVMGIQALVLSSVFKFLGSRSLRTKPSRTMFFSSGSGDTLNLF